MAATQGRQAPAVADNRVEQLLADAGAFLEDFLWESESCRAARDALAGWGLDEEVIREFGVGYAPIGPDELLLHFRNGGYSRREIVAAGLATRSPRRRVHAHFRSRLMFPVRDREGRILGFAGLGTHLGPSWALWVTSPNTELYNRSEAVFALDRAASEIAESGTALLRPDCIEVLRAHQDGETNAVTVHSNRVTREQMLALAADLPGGIDELELDLPEGMKADSKTEPSFKPAPDAPRSRPSEPAAAEGDRPRGLHLKKIGIVIATALAAVNVWTGAPLLAVWVGSHAQPGRLLSYRGVITVVVVLGVLAFLLGWALTWLSAKYDQLSGRPATLARTSPWHRNMRGELDDQLRSQWGLSAPEKVVAGCVVACVLVFEIWFFFFAGSSLPSS